MMQFLPSHGYEFTNCSSIIRDLVYDHRGRGGAGGGGELSANSEANVAAEAEAKAASACNRHSEAERRRRKRINDHLATLRGLLPSNIKTDKASLLAEVVRHVKELKKMAADLEAKAMDDQSDDIIRNNEYYMIPSENDELELTYVGEDSSTKNIMIKARMCCDDRAELIVELMRALVLAHAKLVRTEIGTLGGRVKCVLLVQVSAVTKDQGIHELRRALKVVMDRASLLDLPRNKRPRFSDCV